MRIAKGSHYNVAIDTLNNASIQGTYSEHGQDCLNVNGMEYHLVEWDEISLATCIGVTHYWYNQWLYPKFYKLEQAQSPLAVSKFCVANYPDCTFKRLIRIKKGQGTPIYAGVPLANDNITAFKDYLQIIRNSGVYIKNLTPKECAARLAKLGVPHNPNGDDPYKKLASFKYPDYGWLEYTQIYTPVLNFKLICDEDPAELKKFEDQIEFHVKLMLLIDYIDRTVNISKYDIWH